MLHVHAERQKYRCLDDHTLRHTKTTLMKLAQVAYYLGAVLGIPTLLIYHELGRSYPSEDEYLHASAIFVRFCISSCAFISAGPLLQFLSMSFGREALQRKHTRAAWEANL